MQLALSNKKRHKYALRWWVAILISNIVLPIIGLRLNHILYFFGIYRYIEGLNVFAGLLVMQGFASALFLLAGITNCYAKTKYQSIHLNEDEMIFMFYKGNDVAGFKNRQIFTNHIQRVDRYEINKRNIVVYGNFRQIESGRYERTRNVNKLTLLRVWQDEDEAKILSFLGKHCSGGR